MTDSNDRDFIGEVIAEDNAEGMQRVSVLKETDVSYAASSAPVVQAFWCHEASNIKCVRASDYDELRQQLVDVSNARDEALNNMGNWMALAAERLESLNASEARNAEAGKLLSRCNDSVRLGEDFDLPMSLMIEIDDFLAQSAPATDEQGAGS